MRKLRRSVEKNRRKEKARRALMALMASTVALSDVGTLAVCAGEVQNLEAGDEGTKDEINVTEIAGEEVNEKEVNEKEVNEEEEKVEDSEETNNVEDEKAGVEDETGLEDNDLEEIEEVELGEDLEECSMALALPGEDETETIDASDGSTINISEIEIEEGRINIIISKSGTYTFTGNNKRNDAYVDVSIVVKGGVEANIHFDNFSIVNDDFDYTETTSIYAADGDVINPIVVEGVANVYIDDNSDIKAVSDLFNVSGTLNFVSSTNGAVLDCSISKIMRKPKEDFPSEYYVLSYPLIISGSGNVHFKDANVKFTNEDMDGHTYKYLYLTDTDDSNKVYLEGKSISFEGNCEIEKIYTNLTNLEGLNFTPKELYDMDGNRIFYKSLEGFPANSKIVQINFCGEQMEDVLSIKKPVDIYANSDGVIPAMYCSDSMLFFVESGDDIYAYCYYGSTAYRYYGAKIVKIKFIDSITDAVIESYYSLKGYEGSHGCNLIFPEEDGKYDYNYIDKNGNIVEKDTYVEDNMDIYVSRVEKGKVDVTINGVTNTVDYGVKLSDVSGKDGYYLDINSGKLVKGDELITEPRSFSMVTLNTEIEDGKEWFILSSKEDMEQFAELVNFGNGNINGRLTQDVHLDNSFPMIGTIGNTEPFVSPEEVNDNSYCGTFDGQNNTVDLQFDKSDEVTGLFGCISSGALIQNINLTGSVYGVKYSGGLVGITFSKGGSVTINNCINGANVTAYGEGYYTGGLIGANLNNFNVDSGTMRVNVNYCGNTGHIVSASGNVGGIVGYGNKANIFSCFNVDNSNLVANITGDNTITGSYSRAGSADVVKSEEAFKSGEVTYLMNKAAGSNKWFQTCGEGLPKLEGDTVYAGYVDCHDTELSYANTEFEHIKPGHKDTKSYIYTDGKIVAGCEYCTDAIFVDVDCQPEVLSGSMKGVTVEYNEEWLAYNYPNIVIKYSTEADGEYVAEIPKSAGSYYVKAYVGDSSQEVAISDMYTVKAKPKKSDSKKSDSKNSDSENSNSNNASETEQVITVNPAVPVQKENVANIDKPQDVINPIPKQNTEIANVANNEPFTGKNNDNVNRNAGDLPKTTAKTNTKGKATVNSESTTAKKTTNGKAGNKGKSSVGMFVGDNGNTYKIVNSSSSTISSKTLSILKNNPNMVLRYKCELNGRNYEFIITAEDLEYFDLSLEGYDLAYLQYYFMLKKYNLLSLFKKTKMPMLLYRYLFMRNIMKR